nr:MAG TPA: hypothetical protein [Caudoviricetes sp.]
MDRITGVKKISDKLIFLLRFYYRLDNIRSCAVNY